MFLLYVQHCVQISSDGVILYQRGSSFFYLRYITGKNTDHFSPIKNWVGLERDFSFGKTPNRFDLIQILCNSPPNFMLRASSVLSKFLHQLCSLPFHRLQKLVNTLTSVAALCYLVHGLPHGPDSANVFEPTPHPTLFLICQSRPVLLLKLCCISSPSRGLYLDQVQSSAHTPKQQEPTKEKSLWHILSEHAIVLPA